MYNTEHILIKQNDKIRQKFVVYIYDDEINTEENH